ncbi:hypothetical protein CYMTET_5707 [Cymbomonas tetramitiformis]|uniref:Uncharacterized protein n=1 Tax=Cymbomonas tetramitiformis TaxID=36881 RepID=A0AAE0LIL5_9CHLO|nr:hypothetical protein CYMTET_5707 [Cymbomonas tetramitiformis]
MGCTGGRGYLLQGKNEDVIQMLASTMEMRGQPNQHPGKDAAVSEEWRRRLPEPPASSRQQFLPQQESSFVEHSTEAVASHLAPITCEALCNMLLTASGDCVVTEKFGGLSWLYCFLESEHAPWQQVGGALLDTYCRSEEGLAILQNYANLKFLLITLCHALSRLDAWPGAGRPAHAMFHCVRALQARKLVDAAVLSALLRVASVHTRVHPARHCAAAALTSVAREPGMQPLMLSQTRLLPTLVELAQEHDITELQQFALSIVAHLGGHHTTSILPQTTQTGVQRRQLLECGYARVVKTAVDVPETKALLREAASAALLTILGQEDPVLAGPLEISAAQRLLQSPAGTRTLLYASAAVWCLARSGGEGEGGACAKLVTFGGYPLTCQLAHACMQAWSVTQSSCPTNFHVSEFAHRKRLPNGAATNCTPANGHWELDTAKEVASSTVTFLFASMWLLAYHLPARPDLFGLDKDPCAVWMWNRSTPTDTNVNSLMTVRDPVALRQIQGTEPLIVLAEIVRDAEVGHLHQRLAMHTLFTVASLSSGYLPRLHDLNLRAHCERILQVGRLPLDLRWAASGIFLALLQPSLKDAYATDNPVSLTIEGGKFDPQHSPQLESGVFGGFECTRDKTTNELFRYCANGGMRLIGRLTSMRAYKGDEWIWLSEEALLEQATAVLVFLLDSDEPSLQELGARGAAVLALLHPLALGVHGTVSALARVMQRALTHEVQVLVSEALLNLSKVPENQLLIARKCVYQVLAYNTNPEAPQAVRTNTSCVLYNLKTHPENTTVLYKAELVWRATTLKYGAPHTHADPTKMMKATRSAWRQAHHRGSRPTGMAAGECQVTLHTLLVRVRCYTSQEIRSVEASGALLVDGEASRPWMWHGRIPGAAPFKPAGAAGATFAAREMEQEAAWGGGTVGVHGMTDSLQKGAVWVMTPEQLDEVRASGVETEVLVRSFGEVSVHAFKPTTGGSVSGGCLTQLRRYTWPPLPGTTETQYTQSMCNVTPQPLVPTPPGPGHYQHGMDRGGEMDLCHRHTMGAKTHRHCGSRHGGGWTGPPDKTGYQLPTNRSASGALTARGVAGEQDAPPATMTDLHKLMRQPFRTLYRPLPAECHSCWQPNVVDYHLQRLGYPPNQKDENAVPWEGDASEGEEEIMTEGLSPPWAGREHYPVRVEGGGGFLTFLEGEGESGEDEPGVLHGPHSEDEDEDEKVGVGGRRGRGGVDTGRGKRRLRKKFFRESLCEEMQRLVRFYLRGPADETIEDRTPAELMLQHEHVGQEPAGARAEAGRNPRPPGNPSWVLAHKPVSRSKSILTPRQREEEEKAAKAQLLATAQCGGGERGGRVSVFPPDAAAVTAVLESNGNEDAVTHWRFPYGGGAHPSGAPPRKSRVIDRFAMFKHAEGCQVCQDLFHHFELPTGEKVHLFHRPRCRIEMAEVAWAPPEPALPTQLEMLQEAALPVMAEWSLHPDPMLPLTDWLAAPPEVYAPQPWHKPSGAGRLLGNLPLHFRVEEIPPPWPRGNNLYEPEPEPEAPAVEGEDFLWLMDSTWAPRKAETRALGFTCTYRLLDQAGAWDSMFKRDWTRCIAKVRFQKLCGSDLLRVGEVVRAHHAVIRALYAYYCVIMSGQSSFSMSMGEWMQLCSDIKVGDSEVCTKRAVSELFVLSNFEEIKGTQEADLNEDKAYTRFELVESFVRLGILRYIRPERKLPPGEKNPTPSLALEKLMAEYVRPHAPRVATIMDPNHFRRDRLYKRSVDYMLWQYRGLLETAWQRYKWPNNAMTLPQWIKMLHDCELLKFEVTGLSVREASLCFVWSKMAVTDEIKHKVASQRLSYPDFTEALGRLADAFSPPTPEELEELGIVGRTPTYDYMFNMVKSADFRRFPRRPSHNPLADCTRPLQDKLRQLLEFFYKAIEPDGAINAKYVERVSELRKLGLIGPY